MTFEYTIYKPSPIIDHIITNVRHDEANDTLVIEYSNGESIRLDLTDLIGYEACICDKESL